MTSFSSLPVELQQQCARYLDIATFKSLRLASRQTALNIGSEALFETVILKFNTDSAARFAKVLENEALRASVKRVICDGRDGTCHREDPTDDHYERTPWAIAVTKLSNFPAVRDIEFWFDDEVEADGWLASGNLKQDESYRKFHQRLLYHSLGNAESVEGLTIKNAQDSLIGYTGDLVGYMGEVEGFIKARKRLKRLALLIQTEETAAPETDHEQLGFQQCFDTALLAHWLIPTQSQLTSLTIYCDYPWNPDPFCDLSDLHFPHLNELAFGNWPIAFDWQIDWITSHSETLKRLSLTGCPIVYLVLGGDFSFDWPTTDSVTVKPGIALFATRWSDVFPLFEQRLPHLTSLNFKPSRPYNAVTHFDNRFNGFAQIDDLGYGSNRYITYQSGTGPSPYTHDLYDFEPLEGSNFEVYVWEDG
ncbi:hypothetical protein SLS60_009874 [Paraconiothyrium brasiliense]|uniref:F-box domain-containing protein n=1 Tax=Paraconiothyrium brasiliense TaxID=300254 RepID=A0ABR3QSR4_9PLEO